MEKSTIRVLGIISGAFYILGGFVAAFLVDSLNAIDKGLGTPVSGSGAAETDAILTGFIAGILIIILAATLIMSKKRGTRIVGGIFIIIIGFAGLLNTFGGIGIGLILALVAGILALVYKDATA